MFGRKPQLQRRNTMQEKDNKDKEKNPSWKRRFPEESSHELP
jgi:hypothetical protein